MTWWQRLWRRKQMEEQLEKELSFHLEQHASDLMARGHDPYEARRLARLAFGGPEQVKEECRDARGTRWLEDLGQDFCYAARRLHGKPGFYSRQRAYTWRWAWAPARRSSALVNPILFEPLPYPHAGRIMMIWDILQGSRSDVTFHSYRELTERNHSFDALAVMDSWQPTMTGAAEPERFDGQSVSAGFFRALGIEPALGRDFRASDDSAQGAQGGDPQRRAVAAPLQRRPRGPRAPDHARRRPLYRHRCHATRVRECSGTLRGDLVALAVRPMAYHRPRHYGVGSSPAHGGAGAARRQQRSSQA